MGKEHSKMNAFLHLNQARLDGLWCV
eukprot:COSAG06_NODE_4473_length_4217_cov_97.590092_5_plen_25_part_01